jgi:hypothetical protein
MLKEFTALSFMSSPADAAGLDRMQRQVQTLFKSIFGVQIIKGSLIDVTFPASANSDIKIQHGLGRVPQGFIPVYLSAAGIVYNSSSVAGAPRDEIILKASVSSLVTKLWIF